MVARVQGGHCHRRVHVELHLDERPHLPMASAPAACRDAACKLALAKLLVVGEDQRPDRVLAAFRHTQKSDTFIFMDWTNSQGMKINIEVRSFSV